MALFQWDPWWEFRNRGGDLADFLRSTLPLERTRLRRAAYPPMNICVTDEDVRITLELPGVRREDLDLSIIDDTLTITGTKEVAESEDYERRERYVGPFTRAIQVPKDVLQEEIQAKLTDGVLTITLRKATRARKRQIAVQSKSEK